MRKVIGLNSVDLTELACPWCGRTPGVSTFGLKIMRDREVLGLVGAAHADALGGFYPRASVVVTQLWVRPDDLGELIGTQLIHGLAARLVQTPRARCIVAHGTHRAGTCTEPPAAWLEHMGFVEAAARGQWRLDLRRMIRVPDVVRGALHATVRVLHPQRPAAANRGGSPSSSDAR